MLREITISNFKSISKLKLELGRVNVLIGENGSGKSNILESIAIGSAAALGKLDNEYLTVRGVRITETKFMRSAFLSAKEKEETSIRVSGDRAENFHCILQHKTEKSSLNWEKDILRGARLGSFLTQLRQLNGVLPDDEVTPDMLNKALLGSSGNLAQFHIYSPENSSLRVFQGEGQVLPLGVKGEGLFAHLKELSIERDGAALVEIADKLSLLDWFEKIEVPKDLAPFERSIRIRDRYLAEGALFDQRSANEGFLFLLFYLTIFISRHAPSFFAIDNIDASLNPKLCSELMRQIIVLAEKHDKQVILTTHNPAILDGMNLSDEEQRLLVVYRNTEGHTKLHRVEPPKKIVGHQPMSLSQAFMRGFIGGLPENF